MAVDCLIIINENYDVLGLDGGAEAILHDLCRSTNIASNSAQLPPEIRDLLRTRSARNPDEKNPPLKIGGLEYSCRVMWVSPTRDSPCPPMMAVYLRREFSVTDTVLQAAAEYHLTEREQEALVGMIIGLTGKEIAQRMEISPNTVKAVVRVIMIKMGVATRAAVVGRLLEQNSAVRKTLDAGPLNARRFGAG